jgi:hypothetical protein
MLKSSVISVAMHYVYDTVHVYRPNVQYKLNSIKFSSLNSKL